MSHCCCCCRCNSLRICIIHDARARQRCVLCVWALSFEQKKCICISESGTWMWREIIVVGDICAQLFRLYLSRMWASEFGDRGDGGGCGREGEKLIASAQLRETGYIRMIVCRRIIATHRGECLCAPQRQRILQHTQAFLCAQNAPSCSNAHTHTDPVMWPPSAFGAHPNFECTHSARLLARSRNARKQTVKVYACMFAPAPIEVTNTQALVR